MRLIDRYSLCMSEINSFYINGCGLYSGVPNGPKAMVNCLRHIALNYLVQNIVIIVHMDHMLITLLS